MLGSGGSVILSLTALALSLISIYRVVKLERAARAHNKKIRAVLDDAKACQNPPPGKAFLTLRDLEAGCGSDD